MFICGLPSCAPKEVIIKYLSNNLLEEGGTKCSVFKLSSTHQRDIEFKIIVPAGFICTQYIGKILAPGHFY